MDAFTRVRNDYANDPTRLALVVDGIERAVAKSRDGAALTDREVNRRIRICAEWFLQLRHECGYSTIRAADCLSEALRCAVHGTNYEPSTRSSWHATADASSDRDRIVLLG